MFHTGIVLLAAILIIFMGMNTYPNVDPKLGEKLPKPLRFLLPGEDHRRWLLRSAVFLLIGEVLLFWELSNIVRKDMLSDGKPIPVFIMILAGILPFLTFLPLLLKQKQPQKLHWHQICRKIAVCGLLLLLAEVLLFNAKCFTADQNRYTLTSDDIRPQESSQLRQEGNAYIIDGDAQIELVNLPEGTHGIILTMEQERLTSARLIHIWADMKDDNFRYSYRTAADKFTMAYGNGCTLSFAPEGNLHSVMLHFGSVAQPVTLTEICAVSAVPFRFSVLRYLLLLVLAGGGICILEFRLYEITYDRKQYYHVLAVTGMALLCTWSALLFWAPGARLTEYVQGNEYGIDDPYLLTFDAFQKGQTWLDLIPDPNLETMENPYDHSERSEKGVGVCWDYAYYHGKYYSYFGITPVITLYYPIYLLTGRLPSLPVTVNVYATASAFLICMTILAAVRLTIQKPNLLLLLASLPAAVCCSGVYFCLQYPDKYYAAVASGMCFLLLSLWLGLSGCCRKRLVQKCILFALSGLSLALCAGARPTMAVSAAVLLPFFSGILLHRKETLLQRFQQAGCFLLPLLAGCGGLLAYNAVRFGSPLEFGAAYQMTVSDIRANTLNPALFPAAIGYYFFRLPGFRNTFPYFGAVDWELTAYGRFIYSDASIGALAHPCIPMAMLLLPSALRRKKTEWLPGVSILQKRCFLVLCMAAPVVLAWVDFCMGGVNQRYITDMMPLLTLGTVMIFLRTTDVKIHASRYRITLGTLAVTFCMVWLLMIGLRDCSLLQRCPELYDTMEELLIFWR